VETIIETGCELFYAEGSGARRSELDCEWDAVEAPTNSGNRGQTARVRREV
jgi:hypothetical protein